jgi:hypothetical protein
MKSGSIIAASFVFIIAIMILSPFIIAEGLEPKPESPHIHIHTDPLMASEPDCWFR